MNEVILNYFGSWFVCSLWLEPWRVGKTKAAFKRLHEASLAHPLALIEGVDVGVGIL